MTQFFCASLKFFCTSLKAVRRLLTKLSLEGAARLLMAICMTLAEQTTASRELTLCHLKMLQRRHIA